MNPYLSEMDRQARYVGAIRRCAEPYTPALPRDIFAYRWFNHADWEVAAWFPSQSDRMTIHSPPREWGPGTMKVLVDWVDL